MKRFQVLGTTDERTTCECCGKTNLKKTVALRPTNGDPEVFYGVDCAALALLGSKTRRRRMVDLINAADRDRQQRARNARRAALFAEWVAVEWSPLGGHPTTFMPADLAAAYKENPAAAHAERHRRYPDLFDGPRSRS